MRPLMAELAGAGPPLERLDRFLRSYCSALERDARFRAVLELLLFAGRDAPGRSRELTGRGYRAWLHAFHAVLVEAAQRGELRAGVSPGAASRAVIALTVGLTTTSLQSPNLFSPSRAAASSTTSSSAGLRREHSSGNALRRNLAPVTGVPVKSIGRTSRLGFTTRSRRRPSTGVRLLEPIWRACRWNYAITETRKITAGPVAWEPVPAGANGPKRSEETFEVIEQTRPSPDGAGRIRAPSRQGRHVLEPTGTAARLINAMELEPRVR